jgi:O-antigen/teichoic acid export membrane protein
VASPSSPAPTPPPRPALAAHLKELFSHSAVYGSQDVAAQVINLALTPVYTNPRFLTTADFGVIALLFTFSTVAKIAFRMGLDSGFFRIYYDLDSEEERERLAGTVALFAAGAGTALFLLIVLSTPLILRVLGLEGAHARTPLLLAAADVYAGTFAFIPLSLLRIRKQAATFAAVTVARNLGNTVLKLVLVVSGFGVTGVLWSDFLATAGMSVGLLPILLRSTRPAWAGRHLREVLAFGLPKAPHGIMVQALNLADRVILKHSQPLSVVGIYDKAYALGAGVKFGLSPFETAWQPFVLARMRMPEAPALLSRVITYAAAAFVSLALGVALLGRELLMALTFKNPSFWAGAIVIPVVALAYLLHGFFLLTSIGIGIEKRARYYPMITATAATANIGLDLFLIPRYGMMGAAWATVAGYFVMASLGGWLSHRLYPIPLERGRLGALVAAAVVVYLVSTLAPAALVASLVVKSALLAAFALSLVATGVLRWPGAL